jgi:predicted PurR-regulated permease PerM
MQSLVMLAIAVAALYFARDLFIPLALALILTFFLVPVMDRLRRLHLGRTPSALTALLLSFLIVGIGVTVVATQLVDIADKLPDYQQNISRRLERIRGPNVLGGVTRGLRALAHGLSNVSVSSGQNGPPGQTDGTQNPSDSATKPLPVQVVSPQESDWVTLRDLFGPVMRPVGVAGVVLVFTAFILLRREDLRDRLIKLGGVSKISVTTRALEDAENRVTYYLRYALLINSCFGCFIAGGLWMIGLPNVALWGIIAGAMRFVPYAGILISCAMPLLLSLAIFPGWEKPLLIVALFFFPEVMIANVVEPVVYGANTGTSPLGLLVAAVFWTVLWGPLGLVLSTPLTVCVLVLGRHVPQLSFLQVLLAEESGLTDEARLYGRLLAGDRHESQHIVDQALAEKSLVETYDELLIPALRLTEQDRHKGVLDPTQADAVFEGVKQILNEIENKEEVKQQAVTEKKAGTSGRRRRPEDEQDIVCVAVLDEADEVSAKMLAQVLQRHNCPCAHFAPGNGDAWGENADELIFLSAIPPFGLMMARRQCVKMRRQRPSSTIVVGMWGAAEDPETIKERFGSGKPDYVVTRLADALELVMESRSV